MAECEATLFVIKQVGIKNECFLRYKLGVVVELRSDIDNVLAETADEARSLTKHRQPLEKASFQK